MMKKLLIGLFAVLCAGGASAQQLDVNGQVNNVTPKVVAKSGVLSNVLGLDAKTQQTKKADFKLKSNHIWANANQMQQQARLNMPMLSANAKVAKAEKAAVDEGLTWFSYITSNDLGAVGFDALASGLGVDFLAGQNKYNIAFLAPGNYAKAKIDSVEFWVLSGCQYDNLTVWVSSVKYETVEGKNYLSFPESADKADAKVVVPAADVKAVLDKLPANYVGPISVKLPTPFTIPADGALVGYSYDGKSSDESIVLAGISSEAAGCFFQYDYEGERNFESLSSIVGMSSSIQIGMDVSDCEANDATVSANPELTTLVNTKQQYPFYITNNSATPITQLTYSISVDGVNGAEKSLDLSSPIEPMETASIPYTTAFEDDGVHTVELNISKVNGNTNINKHSSAEYSIIALEKSADRVSVVEEQTGTWCGWCPRGHVALDLLNKQLGDKVVTLAGHFANGESRVDPMNILGDNITSQAERFADYGLVAMTLSSLLGGGGLPGAMFDRVVAADPYVGANTTKGKNGTYEYGATDLVNLLKEGNPSEADFSMTASWADDKNTDIKVDLTTTFNYNRFGSFPYGVAFVLSENGMTGKGATWKQLNYYNKRAGVNGASDFNNPDMAAWFKADSYVSTTYDNVVVQAWNPLGDAAIVDKSKTDIDKGEVISFSTTLKVNSDLIQNYNNLTLSALLVNLNSLAVVNAAKVVLGNCAAGIEDVNSEANNNVVSRYNVNGMRINGTQKGLNIVKLANGKVVKMAVK
ncbi:putative uncharacterized protein [Prevotella sp. CAG:1092]|nr:putative uncharacterized protein [Prevotella sp. CAG:1092]